MILLLLPLGTAACASGDNSSTGATSTTTAVHSPTTTADLVETPVPTCPHADTTVAMEQCLAKGLKALDAERSLVAAAVIAQAPAVPDLTVPGVGSPQQEWTDAEAAFVAYREQSCSAVFDQFVGGTIRGTYEISCKIELTSDHIEFLRGVLLEADPNDPGPHLPK